MILDSGTIMMFAAPVVVACGAGLVACHTYYSVMRQRALRKAGEAAEAPEDAPTHVHKWSAWKEIGRTGDWFHPLLVERKCACGATETDEH